MNLADASRRPAARALGALLLVILIGCAFSADGAFFRWSTHRDVLRQVSVQGILACGMTVVILTAGIDLAVSSTLALCAVLLAKLLIPLHWSAGLAIVAVLATGAAAGAASGALVARFKIQPFIATLALMVFARGLAKHLSGGKKISAYDAGGAAGAPALFDALDDRVLGGRVAVVTLVFLACAVIVGFLLAKTRIGRHWYAIGGNAEAARLAGVPVARALVLAYVTSGVCAAIAGACQAAQETHGDPETAIGYELDAIAMVVIGGTSLSGGRGGMLLTTIGTLTIGMLQKILSLNAVPEAARLMLTGAIIVGAVLLQRGRGR